MRDRVVLSVLATGVVVAVLAWLGIGPWGALVVAVIAIGAACVVYRIEAPRIDLDRPDGWEREGVDSTERVDQ